MSHRRIFTFTVGSVLAILASVQIASAAQISGVTISSVTATSAVVTWTTDTKTDATINFSTDPSYGIVRDPTFTQTSHVLTIPNLTQNTTYHLRVESTDQSGNTNATGGFVFTTTPDQNALTKQIQSEIKQISNPKDLVAINQTVQQTAADVLKPPTVLGAAKVIPDVNGAEFIWTTDRASGSVVHLEPDSTYSGTYSITQGDANESTTNHDVKVVGLDASTKYHFSVASPDSLGLIGLTVDDTFTTKSTLPQIQNPKITNISETVATVTWSTGSVLANGIVDFTNTRTHKTLSMGDPAFLTHHAVELTGLIFGTTYSVLIHATNQSGDVVTSSPITFVTVRDTVPPVISKVSNQSTLFPSDTVEVQTIISWVTDEPAFCQLSYIHGIVRSDTNPPTARPAEQNPLTDHTEVIVGLTPNAVYKFWVNCHDAAGNASQSDDYVLITPDKQKNIVDLILQNFQGTFGWVNNIGK
ncbi:MAG TPA: fibronectin type III domain-containing protein [Candidatus Paceibacterota bacterium]|nr:fibronectin type III domain-containing protein [Candidatus Paceibacterota bacterium]